MEATRRVGVGVADSSHCGHNRLVTSKFTPVSFLPVALFAQFRRLANFYYLGIGLLMLVGTTTTLFQSPYSPSTTLGPLFVMISISLLNEGLTDVTRHRADGEVNRMPVDVVVSTTGCAAGASQLQYVRSGDVVRIRRGEVAPCDVVVLAGAGENNTCYIDTKSIDGETSLKARRAPASHDALGLESGDEAKAVEACRNVACLIECDPPNEHVNVFNGTIQGFINNGEKKKQPEDAPVADGGGDPTKAADVVTPLNKEHVILRGSSVHSAWVLGVCVYSGPETKLALNTRQPPIKFSQLDRLANRAMLLQLLFQAILSLISTIYMTVFNDRTKAELFYTGVGTHGTPRYLWDRWPEMQWDGKTLTGFWGFVTFFVLYCNYIPMSLYLGFDMVTVIQTQYVGWDLSMEHTMGDGSIVRAEARSSTVTDLGQVEYVFSDKTGTLTCNEMVLRRLICAGETYDVSTKQAPAAIDGEGGSPRPLVDLVKLAMTYKAEGPRDGAGGGGGGGASEEEGGERHAGAEVVARPTSDAGSINTGKAARRLLENLMLCNTVLVEQREGTNESTGEPLYQAQSPDEGALVKGGFLAGFALVARTEQTLTARVGGGGGGAAAHVEEREWEVLATNEFDNDRKRMSIVLREPGTGVIVFFCKGADSSMLERASASSVAASQAMCDAIDAYATAGLRTLVYSAQEWAAADYEAWRTGHFEPAANAIHHRDDLLRRAADVAERDLAIVGASAIEDRLQDQVPESIATLRQANVKLWVLTGDKRETAIEIAKSCRLVTPETHMDELAGSTYAANPYALEAKLCELYSREFPLLPPPTRTNGIGLPDLHANDLRSFRELKLSAHDRARRWTVVAKTRYRTLKRHVLRESDEAAEDMDQRIQRKLIEHGGRPSLEAAVTKRLLRRANKAAPDNDNDNDDDDTENNKSAKENDGLETEEVSSKADPVIRAEMAAIVLDGAAVRVLFDAEAVVQVMLFRLLSRYGAVVAARVTPKQKAHFVRLVQQSVTPKPVTLAIGDGANDVNMIMSAQVGVGILGLEGRQAVNASDFAIGQFRFLVRLMLGHGRTDYRRSSKLILYSFYKNACLALLLFFFSFEAGFSGTSFFHEHFTACYNFFLFCQIFWAAAIDEDVPYDYVRTRPAMYDSGRRNLDLGARQVVSWQLQAVAHSALLYYLPVMALRRGTGLRYDVGGHFTLSTIVGVGLIVSMNLKALLETSTFVHPLAACGARGGLGAWGPLASTWFIFAFNFFFFYGGALIASLYSVCAGMDWFVDMWPYFAIAPTALHKAPGATAWLIALLTVGTLVAFDLLLRALRHEFFPGHITLDIEKFHLEKQQQSLDPKNQPDQLFGLKAFFSSSAAAASSSAMRTNYKAAKHSARVAPVEADIAAPVDVDVAQGEHLQGPGTANAVHPGLAAA